jgi:hypothetical protein
MMHYTADDIEGLGYVRVFGRLHSQAWYDEWCDLARYLSSRRHLRGDEMMKALVDQETRRARN